MIVGVATKQQGISTYVLLTITKETNAKISELKMICQWLCNRVKICF